MSRCLRRKLCLVRTTKYKGKISSGFVNCKNPARRMLACHPGLEEVLEGDLAIAKAVLSGWRDNQSLLVFLAL